VVHTPITGQQLHITAHTSITGQQLHAVICTPVTWQQLNRKQQTDIAGQQASKKLQLLLLCSKYCLKQLRTMVFSGYLRQQVVSGRGLFGQ
jgi:hypothetical protein